LPYPTCPNAFKEKVTCHIWFEAQMMQKQKFSKFEFSNGKYYLNSGLCCICSAYLEAPKPNYL